MKLLIVGPIEKDDSISEEDYQYLQNNLNIIIENEWKLFTNYKENVYKSSYQIIQE